MQSKLGHAFSSSVCLGFSDLESEASGEGMGEGDWEGARLGLPGFDFAGLDFLVFACQLLETRAFASI